MSLMVDVTADQSPLPSRLAVQRLASKEVACLAEELVAYHQHFAPLSTDVNSVNGRQSTCADCLRQMFLVKTLKPWPCVCWGRGRMRSERYAPSSSSSGKASGTMTLCWPNISGRSTRRSAKRMGC